MTESDVLDLVRRRWSPPVYACIEHVASATGAVNPRTADACVMGLWPSRGLELMGVEVKVHRSDWLRELKKPEKAETVARYCDMWWIVAAPDVCKVDEVPVGWGFLEVRGDRGLVQVKQAPKLDAQPITRAFLAGLLRRAAASTPEAQLEEVRKKARGEGVAEGIEIGSKQNSSAFSRDLQELERAVHGFEKKSGVRIRSWDGGDIAEAVRRHLEGVDVDIRIAQAAVCGRSILAAVDRALVAIGAAPGDDSVKSLNVLTHKGGLAL